VWVLPPESRRSSALLAIRLSKMADIRRWEMMLRLMPSSANTDRQAIRHCVQMFRICMDPQTSFCNLWAGAWEPKNRIFSCQENVCFFVFFWGADEMDPDWKNVQFRAKANQAVWYGDVDPYLIPGTFLTWYTVPYGTVQYVHGTEFNHYWYMLAWTF
jgi:hypothetical protein